MKKIGTKALRTKLRELIREQADITMPGEEKLAAVVDKAADWLDEQAKWGFLGPLGAAMEAADGPLLRKLLWIPAQLVYDAMKRAGAKI